MSTHTNYSSHKRSRIRRLNLHLVELLESRILLSGSPEAVTNVLLGSSAWSGSYNGSSGGYSPSQMAQAYGFNQITFGSAIGSGAGQTIAIIDAYNDPNIASDLAAFSSQFGLPALNAGGPTFSVVGQDGSSTLPSNAALGDWAEEISLDVEWAHALAPQANILLVEATDNTLANLMTAVDTARNAAGVSVVSMSFDAAESSADATYDSYFTAPAGHIGITFVGSTGDNGTPAGYPAYSPNVVAVGGTSLTLLGTSYEDETAWSGSGGGISQYEAKPGYQSGVTLSSTYRTVPDVSFDGDPSTGVAIYDSYDGGVSSPWVEIGGTSFSAPAWAALIAVADQGRVASGVGTLSSAATLQTIYAMPSGDFRDITSGGNGTYNATAGYDLITGRGSPITNLVARDLMPLTGTVITSGYWANNAAYSPDKALDGDPTTFYASSTSTNGYIGIDLGASERATLTSVSLVGRSGYEYHLATGQIQGSNDGTTWTTLGSVGTAPASGQDINISITSTTSFRYFRYYNSSDYADVAELKFFGNISTTLTGTVITSGFWANNPAYSAQNAFDGNGTTFYASSTSSGGYVGIDLGATNRAILSTVSLLGRSGYEYHLASGQIQASNDGTTWTTIGSVGTAPAAGQYATASVNSTTAYRYFRYYNPTDYADVAELQLYGVAASPLTGTVLTSGYWANNSAYAATNAFDGNSATFYASSASSGGYVGIDLGTSERATLTSVSLLGRSGYEYHLGTGQIQASNNGVDWTTLASVGSAPAAGQYKTVDISSMTAYRYFRYYNPTDYADIAELKLFGTVSASLGGTLISSTPWASNSTYAAFSAFDGNSSTFFASNDSTNGIVGIQLAPSTPAILTSVSLLARPNAESRLVGGEIVASNDGISWYLLGSISSAPAAGQYAVVTISSTVAYTYFAYTNPTNYADVAELQFFGQVA